MLRSPSSSSVVRSESRSRRRPRTARSWLRASARTPEATVPYPGSFGGLHTGPSPVDRGRAGSKHHLITDARGVPLKVVLTGGQRNDVTQLLVLLDGVGPVGGKRGRPRQRADRLLADRGNDRDKYRRALRSRGVKPQIARRGVEHGSGLGTERWVVERTFAWLHNFRRLRTRYERSAELHLAFMLLGCAVIANACSTGREAATPRTSHAHTDPGSSPTPRSQPVTPGALRAQTAGAGRPSPGAPRSHGASHRRDRTCS